ncbi:MAG: Aspartate-semialdehyde dehydrogenase [Calditrichaeota bacterium]|nr:Aspartate-semialdehyde dehydrogenase [Calditrichota bacterium]
MPTPTPPTIAVAGASGLVGRTLLALLAGDEWRAHPVIAYASEKRAGRFARRGDERIELRALPEAPPPHVDYLLSALPASVAREVVPGWRDAGVRVIDKSSAFRTDPAVPLVVPEVNAREISDAVRLIATPNCTTIPIAVALKPLLDEAGLVDVRATSFQAVSGAGAGGLRAWETELRGETDPASPFSEPIHANVIPVIGALDEHGSASEERKVARELRRILALAPLPVAVTAVRVPVAAGHGIAVEAGLARELTPARAIELWREMPGVVVHEDPSDPPTPLDCAGCDEVFIGRVRRAQHRDNALLFWAVTDNLRKGAATNALQILARWLKN